MDSFEWNKILGAILGTLLFLFIVNEVASIAFHSEEPEKMAYQIEIPEGGAEAQGEEKPEVVDFGALLQQASADKGAAIAKRCLQCHTFEKGGPNKTGPNLWGVLGRDIAARPNFKYSGALSKLEGDWTYEKIYEFVAAPSKDVPGTSMTFAGLRRKSDRIDLLAFLRTQSDNPPPIPEPLPEKASEEGATAPAGEGAGEGEAGESKDSGAAAENGAPSEEGTKAGTQPKTPDGESKPAGDDAGPEKEGAASEESPEDKDASDEAPN